MKTTSARARDVRLAIPYFLLETGFLMRFCNLVTLRALSVRTKLSNLNGDQGLIKSNVGDIIVNGSFAFLRPHSWEFKMID